MSSTSRFSTCDWIETSSADTGSSATTSFGPQDERARDPDALPLSAAELMGVAVERLRAEADAVERLDDPVARARSRGTPCDREPLADDVAHAHARVERADRVLEDDLHLAPRVASARARESAVRSAPSKTICPSVGSISRMSVRPSVDLPQPDSPTSPSVSPLRICEVDAVDRLHVADGAPEERRLWTGKYFCSPWALEQDVGAPAWAAPFERAVAHRRHRRGRRRRAPPVLAEPARRLLLVDGEERRLLVAVLERVVAAGREAAARRPVDRARHRAADHPQRLGLRHPERGIDCSSASVYGCCGEREDVVRPGRARRPGRRT